jgi:outer membrane protein TolC
MKPFAKSFCARHTIALALVAATVLVTSGCGIPKLRLGEQGPPLPGTFNGNVSYENSACVMSTEFFTDPNLVDLINQGLAGNQELKILAQNIARANNEVMRRRGMWLPFITAGADASLDKYSD